MASKTVLFIHGMYMTPLCWEAWLDRFLSKGLTALAPGWPGRELPVASLRQNHPDPALAALTLSDIVDHYTRIIQTMAHKPRVVGHSMGGLVTQILLNRGLVDAAVAIDSAPPQGVLSAQWSFIKANWLHGVSPASGSAAGGL